MTPTTLVSGGRAGQRERAIAEALARLPASSPVGLILEGLPDSLGALSHAAENPLRSFIRIAPGCPCCIGNLSMRVSLNRMLRHPPQHLFISLVSDAHSHQVRAFLQAPPYAAYLQLTADLPLT